MIQPRLHIPKTFLQRIARYAFTCFMLVLITESGYAQDQSASLLGTVTTVDGKPAEAISVSLVKTRFGTMTNEKGAFSLANIKPGEYLIKVSGIGLKTEEKPVTLHANEQLSIDFVLKESAGELREVIVSGIKSRYKQNKLSPSLHLNEPILEAPQNIQLITSKALADQQVFTMADGVIRNVSGATRVEHWGELYTRINMRGARAGAFRNGVNITSDWGPLNEDMSFVDHIEFVKGPAGFMMSNGEPAGIYNVVTKKPTGNDFNGEAAFTFGSYDLYRTTLDLDGKLNKEGTVLFRLNLMGQNKNSYRPNEFNNRYSIAPVITYKIDDKTTLTAEYTYQHVTMSDVGSAYAFQPDGFGKLPRNFTTVPAGLDPTRIKDQTFFLNLQHQISSSWKLTAQAAYFDYQQEGSSMWPDSVGADGKILRSVGIWDAQSKYKFGQVYLNGDVKTGAVKHRIITGLDLGTKNYVADFNQYHRLDTVGNEFDIYHPNLGVPDNGYPAFDRSTSIAQRGGNFFDQSYTGIYAQDELGFLDNKLRLTLAGRYTYLKQNDYGTASEAKKFTPRFGLSVSIDNQTSAYALYDQSFVPQSGYPLRDGGNIKPITGNNMELGLKRDWFDGSWSTTLSAYRILKNNEITSIRENEINYSLEIGQNKTQGIEFDMKGEIFTGLNLIANYAYTDSKVSKVTPGVEGIAVGDRVPGYAKHNINTWLTYKLQRGALKGTGVSAGFTYQADRDSWSWGGHDGIQKLPNYFRLDGGAFWEGGKVRITANVFNVLDKYLYSGGYEDWTSPAYYSYQIEAGRNYRLGMAYRF
jgi:iron complex outermembrane receptor protein